MSDMMGHFTLIGADFDPDYVSKKLGIKPSQVRLKGELLKNGNVFNHTEWGIDTVIFENIDFSTLQEALYSKINCGNDVLREVSEVCKARWNILFYIGIRELQPPILHFSPEQMDFFGQINAVVGFDIYAYL